MASIAGICNRALQHCGTSQTILSLTDNLPEARTLSIAYDPTRRALLRVYPWSFAVARVVLAPDSVAPAFDYLYQFTLPSDCVRVVIPNNNTIDWVIEGRKLLSNGGSGAPIIPGANLTYVAPATGVGGAKINLRYISDVVDPNVFDAMFAEAFALQLAVNVVDKLTQSNSKKQVLMEQFKAFMSNAYLSDSLEKLPADPPEDSWVSAHRA